MDQCIIFSVFLGHVLTTMLLRILKHGLNSDPSVIVGSDGNTKKSIQRQSYESVNFESSYKKSTLWRNDLIRLFFSRKMKL